ncbi:MAG: hypothetical protein J1E32_05900 [Treponema sp.]|nr:hypothetical protein [Treponema sp.]
MKDIGFDKETRANVRHEMWCAYAKHKAVLRAAATLERPLIVFCRTRFRAERVARMLAEYAGYDAVRFYHEGLTTDEKAAVRAWFLACRGGILATTDAYDMDKPNVRTVVHLDVSERLETFRRETDCAGRDGNAAVSVVVWGHEDDVRYRQARARAADDAEFVVRFVRRNRRLYTRAELVRLLVEKLNARDRAVFGINVWEVSDVVSVFALLVSEGRVRICGRLWNGRVDVGTRSPLLALIPRPYRRLLWRLARLPARVRARWGGSWVRTAFCGSAPRTTRSQRTKTR